MGSGIKEVVMSADRLITYLVEPFQKFTGNFQAILPNLIGALGLVAIGLLLAFLLRAWTTALLRASNRLIMRRAKARGIETTALGTTAPSLLSRVIFWLVFLFFLAAAIETLGQPVISDWSSTVSQYLPNVLAAALIVFVGAFLGNITKAAIERFTHSTQISHGELLGRLVQLATLITAIIIAIDQLGIQIQLLIIILAIVTGMLAGGFALAFAFGAKTSVSNVIASHYVMKRYQAGHTVRIGDMEGRIMEITLTAVVLETPDGITTVPAHRFSEEATILLKEGR